MMFQWFRRTTTIQEYALVSLTCPVSPFHDLVPAYLSKVIPFTLLPFCFPTILNFFQASHTCNLLSLAGLLSHSLTWPGYPQGIFPISFCILLPSRCLSGLVSALALCSQICSLPCCDPRPSLITCHHAHVLHWQCELWEWRLCFDHCWSTACICDQLGHLHIVWLWASCYFIS